MFSDATIVDPATVRAYSQTHYLVTEPGRECVLCVGEHDETLLQLQMDHGVNCSAFITACNPYSQTLTNEANRQRQAELASVLDAMGLTGYVGVGRHPDGNWPAEPSFLVLGIDLAGAQALGRRFDQNAVIWCGADAIPQLVMLR